MYHSRAGLVGTTWAYEAFLGCPGSFGHAPWEDWNEVRGLREGHGQNPLLMDSIVVLRAPKGLPGFNRRSIDQKSSGQ